MTSWKRHQDRVYIVTGGGSGIGKATAVRLAAEGAAVVIADVRADGANGAAAEIADRGGRATAVACDVARESDIANLVSEATQRFGGLDGFFSNAGTAGGGWIHDMPLEEWERVIRINLTGAFLLAKHALPVLIARGGGSIVTTGSIASIVVGPGGSSASYAASKGGLLQLTRQIAVDYGPQRIRANCLCPGGVATNLGVHVREDAPRISDKPLPRQKIGTPLGRIATPDELAAAVSFLLSDEASFITGIALLADGGFTAI